MKEYEVRRERETLLRHCWHVYDKLPKVDIWVASFRSEVDAINWIAFKKMQDQLRIVAKDV